MFHLLKLCSKRKSKFFCMPNINNIPWKLFEKFLIQMGCTFGREKGDHRIWHKNGLRRSLVVPRKSPLFVAVIKNNLKLLNVHEKEFLEIIKKL